MFRIWQTLNQKQKCEMKQAYLDKISWGTPSRFYLISGQNNILYWIMFFRFYEFKKKQIIIFYFQDPWCNFSVILNTSSFLWVHANLTELRRKLCFMCLGTRLLERIHWNVHYNMTLNVGTRKFKTSLHSVHFMALIVTA